MIRTLVLLAAASLVLLTASGCLLEEKVLDIVLNQKATLLFRENHVTETFTTPDTLYLADTLDQALEEADLSPGDIDTARIISGSYEVTDFDTSDPAWVISGSITVERLDVSDGPDTIVIYSQQSIPDALNVETFADLDEDGIDLVHRAVDDYLGGGNPILVFRVNNGDCNPTPSELEPLEFDWTGRFYLYIIIEQTFEVPDPF